MRYLFLSLLSLVVLCGCGNNKTTASDSVTSEVAVAEAQEVADSVSGSISEGMPTVLDFWAEWCGPCRQMKPLFESLEKKYEGRVAFKAVNVDEDKVLADKFGIEAIPTFVFLDKNGNEISRIVGMASEEELTNALNAIEK